MTLGFALATASALATEGQEIESGSALQEVTVTSTRIPRRIADEPARVEVIGPEELEEKVAMSPGNVTMLLNESAGLHVQMTSPGLGAANVRIEGLEGRYSQILSDGLPLYGGQAGSTSLLQIPPLDLGRVEVMKGVASALYGASALGGVINFISRRPDGAHELLVNETSQQETDLALWWAGAPADKGWSYSVTATGSRQTAQDVNDDGWADLPAYRRAVIQPRLYWRDDAGRELYVTAGATVEDRTGGTVAGGRVLSEDVNSTPFLEAFKTRRYDAGLTSLTPLAPDLTLSVRASFTDRDLQQTFGGIYEPNRARTGLAEVDVNGTSGAHHWVVGTAFEQDDYRDETFPAFDYTYRVPSLLAQDDYDASDSVTLSASGRLDVHNQYGTFVSPRLAALWRPGGRGSPWQLRLAVGTGFFAPTPITDDTEAAGLARILPLAGLKAERARGISVDVDRLWSLSHGSLETDFSVFGSSIAHAVNLLEVSASPPEFAFDNDPQPTRTFGTELVARWRSGPLEIVATHTYVSSTEFEAGEPSRRTVPLNPRHSAGLTAAWEQEGVGRIGVETYYTGRQSLSGTDTPNPYRTMSPSYVEFGLLVVRQFGSLNVFLNGENLTDRRMTRFQPLLLPARAPDGRWTTDAWGPLDGRVINLGVRWRFGGSTGDHDAD